MTAIVRVAPFHAADSAILSADMEGHVRKMASGGMAFTFRAADERVLLISGILRVHATTGTAWAIVLPGIWGHMGRITRMMTDYFDGLDLSRIDMLVRADFLPGLRWAARLGFTREAVLRRWAPDGGDMVMFARIREAGEHG